MKEVLEIVKKHWDIDALSADKLKGGMVNISWRITTPDASYVFVERREQQDIQTYIKLLECLDQQFYSRLAQPSLLPEKTLDNQRFVATEKGEYLLRPFVGDKKILAGNHFYELGKQIRILQECEPPVAMENWERRMFGEEDRPKVIGYKYGSK